MSDIAQQALVDHQAEPDIPQQTRLNLMRQQVNQSMGADRDLAARMARMHIPTVPPPYLENTVYFF